MRLRLGLGLLFAIVCGCSGSAENQTGSGQGGSGASGTGGSGTGASGSVGSATNGAGGSVDFAACSGPGQCTLAVPGCCGSCGPITLESVDPINAMYSKAFHDSTCKDPGMPCPDCASLPNGNLYAYCGQANHCQEADVTQQPLSECAVAADCTLRWGLACCPGCTGTWEPDYGGDLVAIATSKLADLAALVCDGNVACDECAPEFPPGASAECVAGHCAVVAALAPGG